MKRQDIITLLFTFVVGFFFGMYLYTTGFMQDYDAPDVQSQQAVNDFALTAEVYGGCRDTCPSFQILADGTYRYMFTPTAGAEQIIRDGSLPRALRRDISEAFTAKALTTQAVKTQPAVCNSFTDGIDVRYRVTLAGNEYLLDTCGTAVDTNSAIWNTLVKTWNYFETGSI